jgi:protein-tyrosine phosphatase
MGQELVADEPGEQRIRHVELGGCHNFRDLGGYPTTDGRATRWRQLFRSDGLTRLTPEDLTSLATLSIGTVVDLRTALEVEFRGRFPAGVDGFRYHHLPLTDTLPGEEESPAWHDVDFVTLRYRRMLSEGTHSVVDAVCLFADERNLPAVFHCSVGKDRTGVLAAVVLGFLGVPDPVIVDDYLLSSAPMERVLKALRLEFPDASEIVERYSPVILSVHRASIEGFLGGVHEDYGSFDELAVGLGITDEVRRLRALLLEVPARDG